MWKSSKIIFKVGILIIVGSIFSSCNPNPGIGGSSTTATGGGGSGPGDQRAHILNSVHIINNQLILNGDRFTHIGGLTLSDGNDFNETLQIEGKSKTQIFANFQRSVLLLVGKALSLTVSDAFGAASYTVTVQLGSGSGLTNLGTWDANSNTPTLSDNGTGPVAPSSGNYYVVSTTGTTTVDSNSTWSAGDWILYDAALDVWKRIQISNTVSSVFSRAGAVTAATNDYTWAQIDKSTSAIGDLSTVDLSGDAVNKALVSNGSGSFTLESVLLDTGNAVGTSDLANDSVTLAKLYDPAVGAIIIGASGDAVELDVKTSGQILVGTGTTAASVALSGDATLAAGGAITIANDAITTVKILDGNVTTAKIADNAITLDKIFHPTTGSIIIGSASGPVELAGATSGQILVGDGSTLTSVAVSGDTSLSSAGVSSITAGVIVDADINASANIDASKLGTGIVSNTEFNYLDGLTTSISTTLAQKVSLTGDTMTGNLAMGTNDITGTGDVGAGGFTSSGQAGVVLDDTGSAAGELRFIEVGAGTDYIAFKAPTSVTSSTTFSLPDGAGSSGQVLSTNGSNTLFWVTIVASGDAAGGELTGTYPNPTVADNTIDSANIIGGSIIDSDVNASAAIARSKLGTGTASHVVINDGSGDFSSEAQLAVTRGGTGSGTAGGARTNLGLVIGTDVQAYNSELDEIISLNSNTDNTFIVGSVGGWSQENASSARTSMGVGTGDSPTLTGLTLSGIVSCGGGLGTDGSGNLTCNSDEKLKDILGEFKAGIDEIMGIRPMMFRWNKISKLDSSTENAGFIAQNIQKVIPEAVAENSNGYLNLSLTPIVAALVNATQDQQDQIEKNKEMYLVMEGKLKIEIDNVYRELISLKEENQDLKKRVERLEKLLLHK